MFKDGKGRELPSFADSIVDHYGNNRVHRDS